MKPLKPTLAGHSFFNEQKIKEASHLVVFFAKDNVAEFEENFKQVAPQPILEFYAGMKAGDEKNAKTWFQKQVYISLGFFLAACGAEGIDATPMEGIDTDYYSEKLQEKATKQYLL